MRGAYGIREEKTTVSCNGLVGDYLCPGWRERAARIRERDGKRCRGCNRGEDEVRLEVHHRVYGTPGHCGGCYLTGVSDEDLTTLCVDCHDGITDIRRRVRYGSRAIEIELVTEQEATRTVVRVKTEIPTEFVSAQSAPGIVIRRTAADILGKE